MNTTENQIATVTYEGNTIKIELNLDYLASLGAYALTNIAEHEGEHLTQAIYEIVSKYKRAKNETE